MRTPNRPFTMAESARVRGGSILTLHGDRCASHNGGECACNPRYKLVRAGRRGR